MYPSKTLTKLWILVLAVSLSLCSCKPKEEITSNVHKAILGHWREKNRNYELFISPTTQWEIASDGQKRLIPYSVKEIDEKAFTFTLKTEPILETKEGTQPSLENLDDSLPKNWDVKFANSNKKMVWTRYGMEITKQYDDRYNFESKIITLEFEYIDDKTAPEK